MAAMWGTIEMWKKRRIKFNRCDRPICRYGRSILYTTKPENRRKTSPNRIRTNEIFHFSKFLSVNFFCVLCGKVFTQRVINWMKLEHVIREQMIRRGLLLLSECVMCVCVCGATAGVLSPAHKICSTTVITVYIPYLEWISWWCGFQRNTIQQRHTRRD